MEKKLYIVENFSNKYILNQVHFLANMAHQTSKT